jgi:hypothetical protein
LIYALLAFAALLAVGASSVGLRRSPSAIRESILLQTPLGSDSASVMALVNKEGWESQGFNSRSGFLKQESPGKSEVV